MDYFRTDEEQGEVLKKWLRTNGPGLGFALLVGIGSVLGYQKWQSHQVLQQFEAAASYQELIELSDVYYGDNTTDADYDRLLAVASTLRQGHERTNYSALGAAIVAAQAVERSDFDLAVGQLTYAVNTVSKPELKALMSLRLARLELELDELDAALMRVQAVSQSEFEATRLELEGDIFVAQGANTRARVQYQKARQLLMIRGLNTAVVNLKLSALPEVIQ